MEPVMECTMEHLDPPGRTLVMVDFTNQLGNKLGHRLGTRNCT